MKQKGLITLLAAILCFSLCSCGSNGASGGSESTETAETAQESDNSQETTVVAAETVETATAQESYVVNGKEVSKDEYEIQKAMDNAEMVHIGDNIDLSYIGLTLDSLEIAERYDFEYVKDTSVGTSTKTAHIEPSAGMKLVSLVGTFTNRTNKAVYTSNNLIYGNFIIDGNEYKGKLKCYDTETAESFMEVAAQQSITYFFYVEVPTEIADNITDVNIYFGFVNDFESKPISSIRDLDSLYWLNGTPTVAE